MSKLTYYYAITDTFAAGAEPQAKNKHDEAALYGFWPLLLDMRSCSGLWSELDCP